jgi:hypothetical protein
MKILKYKVRESLHCIQEEVRLEGFSKEEVDKVQLEVGKTYTSKEIFIDVDMPINPVVGIGLEEFNIQAISPVGYSIESFIPDSFMQIVTDELLKELDMNVK